MLLTVAIQAMPADGHYCAFLPDFPHLSAQGRCLLLIEAQLRNQLDEYMMLLQLTHQSVSLNSFEYWLMQLQQQSLAWSLLDYQPHGELIAHYRH